MALVPKHIKQLGPYKPGTSIDQVQREFGIERVIKLASNENPLGPSKRVLNDVNSALEKTHRYPDSSGFLLRTLLAKRFKLKIEPCLLLRKPKALLRRLLPTRSHTGAPPTRCADSFVNLLTKLPSFHCCASPCFPERRTHYLLGSHTHTT